MCIAVTAFPCVASELQVLWVTNRRTGRGLQSAVKCGSVAYAVTGGIVFPQRTSMCMVVRSLCFSVSRQRIELRRDRWEAHHARRGRYLPQATGRVQPRKLNRQAAYPRS